MADPGGGAAPPRWAERWLEGFLPADLTGRAIRGDLREEYAELAGRRPVWVADAWYVWEALRLRLTLGKKRGGGDGMKGWSSDLRHAGRALLRTPGFTAVTVLTLGLGLGANTAIFAALRAVVLKPLPFDHPSRVVALRHDDPGKGQVWALTFPQFEALEANLGDVSGVAAWRPVPTAITFDDGRPPARVSSAGATARLFPLLGIEPELGRGFSADDEIPGRPHVALVSHDFWTARLASDPMAIGRGLRLDGELYTVVGVLPASFSGDTDGGGVLPPAAVEVWFPYRNSPAAEGRELRGLTNVNPVARLGDGVTLRAAQAELDATVAGLPSLFEEHDDAPVVYKPAQALVTSGARTPMALLWAAVSLVLLLACVNAANLIIGRTDGRAHELSLRRALGAGRVRILRQLLTESMLLAAGGALVGAVLAASGLRVMVALDPDPLPRFADTRVDGPTMALLGVTAAVVGLILALLPWWGASRARADGALRGERTSSRRVGRLRPVLVVTQVALATVLLTGAGLLVRSLDRVLGVDPGFDAHHVLSARVDHPTAFVSDEWPEHVRFVQEVVERLRAAPGVEAAAAAYQDPTDGGWNNSFTLARDGEDAPLRGGIYRPVSPGYFATVRIPIIRGRDFGPDDVADAPGVAIVNEAFVRRYFPDVEPLGEHLHYGSFWGIGDPDVEIVGVVADVHFAGREADVPPALYFPHAQQPVKEMSFLVRTSGEPRAFVDQLRRIVADVDPVLPVYQVTTLEEKLTRATGDRRFLAALLVVFAVIAVTLAGVGLYGVLGFTVARRTKEIGVRVALGARGRTVLGLVVREGLGLVVVGVALGLLGSFAFSRGIRGFLFGVSSLDPSTYLAVPGLLLAVGVIACLVPAWRAVRVDPVDALSAE